MENKTSNRTVEQVNKDRFAMVSGEKWFLGDDEFVADMKGVKGGKEWQLAIEKLTPPGRYFKCMLHDREAGCFTDEGFSIVRLQPQNWTSPPPRIKKKMPNQSAAMVGDIKIEKGVPLPMNKIGWPRVLAIMEPTDSFVVKSRKERMSVFVAAKRLGMQMTTKKIGDDEYRIWYVGPKLKEKLMLPISALKLTTRAENCLLSAHIDETLSDLVKMTEADLLKIRNLGKVSLEEIKKKLNNIGLRLGMKQKQDFEYYEPVP